MKLNFSILCDNAFVDNDGQLSIIQIFEFINVIGSFPASHPKMAIVTNYSMNQNDVNIKHIQQIEIIDPTDNIIASLNITAEPKENRDKLQFISSFINLNFKMPGQYKIKVVIDDNEPEFPIKFNLNKLSTTNE